MSVGGIGPSDNVGQPQTDLEPVEQEREPFSNYGRTTPATAGDPEAQSILQQMRALAGAKTPSALPGFLRTPLDNNMGETATVKQRILEDQSISTQEALELVESVFDFGDMTEAERWELRDVLQFNNKELQPAVRKALAEFVGVNDMPPTLAATIDLGLPTVNGKDYVLHPKGWFLDKANTGQLPHLMSRDLPDVIANVGEATAQADGCFANLSANMQLEVRAHVRAWVDMASRDGSPVSGADQQAVLRGAGQILAALKRDAVSETVESRIDAAIAELSGR